ncbi:GFA family protein [Sphingomonas sp. DT-204]|uniref:GFA family protein n=1 Tax=Sphingomonas sp. DT-204 TaxID=3396166 RepID=UPI003F19F3DC
MSDPVRYSGGCLCGAIRWKSRSEPDYMGICCCADCRKASGSGFVPFMGFAAADMSFSGEPRQYRSTAIHGGEATRNFCPQCGGLVFGGGIGETDSHTIYAGSLDDASLFRPTMALFVRDRPTWVELPPGLTLFETMPE